MYTSDIQGATGIKTTLNGPQGHVSARTVASVAMMDTGLQRLYANLGKFNYRHTNLQSCMTLDVENCHSTVRHKQGNRAMAEFCRSFGVAMKEAVKRVTIWAAFYHTSRQSWYPKPEGALRCRRFRSWNLSQTSICAQLTAMHSGTGHPSMVLL